VRSSRLGYACMTMQGTAVVAAGSFKEYCDQAQTSPLDLQRHRDLVRFLRNAMEGNP
jgi:hypothetical protein